MDYTRLTRDQLIAQLEERDENERGGIRLTYKGQTPPWRIVRRVRPRRQKIENDLCIGDEADQDCNLIVEGENLQAMVSLYKYRGQVDLVLTDPPYNTGRDFRYNDKWDEDPNDPDLGRLVAEEDGSRHSKWLRFMEPRIWMMREMLKPSGVFAICIDHRELYRLGILLDHMFGEENRLAIINWQKTYSPKKSNHVSTATEYVLVYAKNSETAKTGFLQRTEKMNARYANPDCDPEGDWNGDNIVASEPRKDTVFGIQSPFTGQMHYPEGEVESVSEVGEATHHWRPLRKEFKSLLEAWGSKYVEKDLKDGRGKALILKGAAVGPDYAPSQDPVVSKARAAALKVKKGVWPKLFFLGENSEGRPRVKRYAKHVTQGRFVWTYWADEDYEEPFEAGPVSWPHEVSGHSQTGLRELDQMVGKGHGFQTVKPLRLFKKIIQIWTPPNGLVMDPFAGSGTSGHAVLELNADTGTNRRFILVEQGRPNKRDDYARTLTATRIARAVTGERVDTRGNVQQLADPLPGGFRFCRLSHLVDSDAVLALEREEMIDLLITSHWDQGDRSASFLRRLPAGTERHLFGVDGNRRGYFLVWDGPKGQNRLNRAVFKEIVAEGKAHELNPPYHVYARLNSYDGPNVEFYQIPDRILEKLGVNTTVEPFNAQIREDSVA